MFQVFYNFLFAIYLIIVFPKLLYQRIRFNKYKKILPQKFGIFNIPFIDHSRKPVLWFHAVSLGEVKAGLTFLKEIKEKYPDSYVVFTTLTATGYNELNQDEIVDFCFYLPFDFSWIMKRLMKEIKPNLVFLVETDFWFNFLKEAKKYAKVFLINGKISQRSSKRFILVKQFARRLFQNIDFLCVQNEEYLKRFSMLIAKNKIAVTGNVKFDLTVKPLDNLQAFRQKYGISKTDKIITIASTHNPEERLLLEVIRPFLNDWKVLLAPRHPERFEVVEKLIDHKNIILVKDMGVLPSCFSISKLAIIGGSFSNEVGGHNIIEPCLYNIPVIFGPHMFNQKDFVYLAMKYQLGYQIPISGIPGKIKEIESENFSKAEFSKHLKQLILEISGSSHKTLKTLWPLIDLIQLP